MRDPGSAAVSVVLDDDDPGIRYEERPEPRENRSGVPDEVEGVGREQAVERPIAQVHRPVEIASEGRDGDRGIGGRKRRGELPEVAGIPVDREDLTPGTQQIGKREGERASPSPELQPAATGA